MLDQYLDDFKSQLKELIQSTLREELIPFQEKLKEKEEKPVVYRTRKYVKELLHISYPTLDKYSQQPGGLLTPKHFGRRVLYDDAELNLALPKIRTMLNSKKEKAA